MMRFKTLELSAYGVRISPAEAVEASKQTTAKLRRLHMKRKPLTPAPRLSHRFGEYCIQPKPGCLGGGAHEWQVQFPLFGKIYHKCAYCGEVDHE